MEKTLVKIRETQIKLGKCLKSFADPIKKQRISEMINELKQIEQNMLFKNILSIQPFKPMSRLQHLNPEQTNTRVQADQMNGNIEKIRNLVGTNIEKQVIVAQLDIQRDDAEKLIYFNRILAELLNMKNVSRSTIVDFVKSENIPSRFKNTLQDQLVLEFQRLHLL